MKKAVITGAIILAVGLVLSAAGVALAGGDLSVLDISTSYWHINTGLSKTAEERERVEETYSAERFSKIEASTISDGIVIGEAEDGLIHLVYYASDSRNYKVSASGATLKVEQNGQKFGFFLFNLDLGDWDSKALTVLLPRGSAFTIEANTVSGDVEAALSEAAALSVRTVSGAVSLSVTETESVRVSTTSGDMDIRNISCDTLTLSTTSGKTQLSGRADRMTFSSVSGKLTLNRVDCGKIEAHTVSGNIGGSLAGAESDYSVSFSTVSGETNLRRGGSGSREVKVSTTSGNAFLSFEG